MRTKHSSPPPLRTADSRTFVDCFIMQFTKSPNHCGLIRLFFAITPGRRPPELATQNKCHFPSASWGLQPNHCPGYGQVKSHNSARASAAVSEGDERRAVKKEAVASAVNQGPPACWSLPLSYRVFSNTLAWCVDNV